MRVKALFLLAAIMLAATCSTGVAGRTTAAASAYLAPRSVGIQARPHLPGAAVYHGAPVMNTASIYTIFWLPPGRHLDPSQPQSDASSEAAANTNPV